MLVRETPTRLRLEGYEGRRPELAKFLTFIDKKVDFTIKKFRNNRWFIQKHGEEAFKEQLDLLKAQRSRCLLFEDNKGLWTYTGLSRRIASRFQDTVRDDVSYPEPALIPWSKEPKNQMRPYQIETNARLLEVNHGAVAVATGLGKSLCILHLCKTIGLKTVVMAPSISIAGQLYDELYACFGPKYVGMVGDGKKKTDKLFTVAVAASLARMEPNTKPYEDLLKAQVFIADESHLTPAKTLSDVCFGLFSNVPYRFFFSATQIRGDGLELLLESIIGDIVFSMDVKEGIERGFLARLMFKMLRMTSGLPHLASNDAMEQVRYYQYYNPKVNKIVADIANKSWGIAQRPVLILIDEIEQFTHLLPYLRHDVRFAHGTLTAEQKKSLPAAYHEADNKKLVEQFNNHEFPILVGTSCISTGTDIRAVRSMIYHKGGRSEVEAKQGAGRCTRRIEGTKEDCIITDIMITDVELLHKHATIRKEYWQELSSVYSEIPIG